MVCSQRILSLCAVGIVQGYIGLCRDNIRLYRGCIGIMEKKMETTIYVGFTWNQMFSLRDIDKGRPQRLSRKPVIFIR